MSLLLSATARQGSITTRHFSHHTVLGVDRETLQRDGRTHLNGAANVGRVRRFAGLVGGFGYVLRAEVEEP